MQNSKLIRILKTFSDNEIKSFSKFLSSPFFGCKPYVTNFFNTLKKYHPDYPGSKISKEVLFKKLYPDKPFDDAMLRRIISYLLEYLEDFMIVTELNNHKIKRNELLIEQFNDRQLPEERDEMFITLLKFLDKELEKNPGLINNYTEVVCDKMGYDWLSLEVKTKQATDLKFAAALTDNLLYNFLEGFYQLAANRKRLNYSEETGLDLIVKHTDFPALMLDYKKTKGVIKDAVLIEYFIASIYMRSDSDANYQELKKLVFKKFKEFDHEMSERLFQKMQNFCVVKIHEGKENFRKELFELYDFYFYKSGKKFSKGYVIHPLLFRNTFKSALMESEIKWAEKFLGEFVKYIEPKFRDNFYNFFMSELKFESKEFEESLNFHSKINFDAVIQKFDYRLLQLKLYYELGYYEEAIYAFDSVRKFTRGKHDIPKIQVTFFENSLKYYLKLLNIKVGIDKKTEPEFLLRQLNKEKDIHKKWFEEKIGELTKNDL